MRDRRTTAAALGFALAVLLGGCSGGSSPTSATGRPSADAGSRAAPATDPVEPPSPSPSAGPLPSPSPRPLPSAPPPAQLPRGGRVLFPTYRVVAYYGAAGTSALGVLGETSPDRAAARVTAAARPFGAPHRPVLPAFELIVSVAQGSAGPDGDYSSDTDPARIQAYLDAARRMKGLLLLDIQPGRADFLPKVKRYERFLAQPDVGLALDPEWHMGPTQVPGRVIGSSTAASINAVSAYLAELTARRRLPQKLFVVHQFVSRMLPDRARIVARRGLATTFHIDGFGSRAAKLAKYAALHANPPFANGLKLFYDEDIDRLQPAEAVALRPSPDLISYQ